VAALAPDPAASLSVLAATATPTVDWAALWAEFGGVFEQRSGMMAGTTEVELRDELIFCVLGGHAVAYELARSAADVVRAVGLFGYDRDDAELIALLEHELNIPQFLPRRIEGSLRRYRYPRRKAQLLVACRGWVNEIGSLREALLSAGGQRASRELLCRCPGIGPKSASWLLRNCGLGEDLAILDVHVLRAMASVGRLDEASLPRDYDRVEAAFLEWCHDLGASAAAFDLMLWELSRAPRE
jgi:thermostable 8-oxoguanine DNA glycosylase